MFCHSSFFSTALLLEGIYFSTFHFKTLQRSSFGFNSGDTLKVFHLFPPIQTLVIFAVFWDHCYVGKFISCQASRDRLSSWKHHTYCTSHPMLQLCLWIEFSSLGINPVPSHIFMKSNNLVSYFSCGAMLSLSTTQAETEEDVVFMCSFTTL